MKRKGNGFRPLSGYLISKSDGFELTQNFINYVFPSPLGVSYFQIIAMVRALGITEEDSFRPLSGYLISK